MSKATPFQIKDVALLFMETMNMPDEVISEYNRNGTISLFGGELFFGGISSIFVDSELCARIRTLQQKYGVKVFAVIRDFLPEFGELYSFLCISQYDEDWKYSFAVIGDNIFRCYAFVWNVHAEHLSEFGSVYIESHDGIFRRVG